MAISSLLSIDTISAGQRLVLEGLHGSSQALAIAQTALTHAGVSLVLCADAAQAEQIESEIRFFLTDCAGSSAQLPVLHFPAWETLPYDRFSPHQDITSDRLAALYQLCGFQQAGPFQGVLVLPVASLMNRLPPQNWLQKNSLKLDSSQPCAIPVLRQQLEIMGYHCVETVFEHGEFAVRGSLVDIFPMGSRQPYRVDWLDDEIESIRIFDPESQRTIEKVDSLSLLPARELPMDATGINTFCNRWHEAFPEREAHACPVYQDVSAGISPAGIEYYLPLFFEDSLCQSLLDYLPNNSNVFIIGEVNEAAQNHWRDIQDRYQESSIDAYRPVLKPKEIFFPVEDVFEKLKNHRRFIIESDYKNNQNAKVDLISRKINAIEINQRSDFPLKSLEDFLLEKSGRPIIFSVESQGRRESLLELLCKINIHPVVIDGWFDVNHDGIFLIVGPLSIGFESNQCILITESELFGRQIYQERRRQKISGTDQQAFINNLNELRDGMTVVHVEHGIGRYCGLVSLEIDDLENEFLLIEYAEKAKLYVPVSSLHLISRYCGVNQESPLLHKLGSDQWKKAKKKAAEQIRDVAAELLDIYANRAARKGHAFSNPLNDLTIFSSEFPFEETADQHQAIQAVIADMLSDQPMDRLICGDVGFGKTEVAMRAAFVAVHNKKQVAILVPTTLLAQQHYENFKDRFANWPVTIEVISRFKSLKEQKDIFGKIGAGKIDILIGTHKLLSQDLSFDRLGLLIIDEEHRFGVQQKERLKALKSEVDILTLTATPIPRTLNMALSGMREISIIATPPAKRLSVKTFVRQKENSLLKEAILREILRGGQVFYLHNDIKSIERTRQDLEQLIPEARIAIGHGQMRERELERVMADFYHKRFNILICTTIIETGIDIPSANTIIIERADQFGLAQLHQLRGRVGRSHHQAYAYLLAPPKKAMTPDAIKRLEAISASDELGAGFTLATHDLEIRGAGELLGDQQSGQIESIGFSLYMEMLERTVQALKDGKTIHIDDDLSMTGSIEINLNIPALIPEDYLPDPQSRLILYKRISNTRGDHDLKELQVEMIDRFGLLPQSCKNLFRLTALKQRIEPMGITKLEVNEKGGRITFSSKTTVSPLLLVMLVQNKPQHYKMADATRLRFFEASESVEERFKVVEEIISLLEKSELQAA